jgi:hypothetical protein
MKLLFSVLRITLGVALLAPLALYLLQDRLLFFPQPLDALIPPAHARRLLGNWGGPSNMVSLDGAEHDNVNFHERYWPAIADFLKRQNIP